MTPCSLLVLSILACGSPDSCQQENSSSSPDCKANLGHVVLAVGIGAPSQSASSLSALGGISAGLVCKEIIQNKIRQLEANLQELGNTAQNTPPTDLFNSLINLRKNLSVEPGYEQQLQDLVKQAKAISLPLPPGYPVFHSTWSPESDVDHSMDLYKNDPDPEIQGLWDRWNTVRQQVKLLQSSKPTVREAYANLYAYAVQVRLYMERLQSALSAANKQDTYQPPQVLVKVQSYWPLYPTPLQHFYVRTPQASEEDPTKEKILGWYTTKQPVEPGLCLEFDDFPKGTWGIYTRTDACELFLLATVTIKGDTGKPKVELTKSDQMLQEVLCYPLPFWVYLFREGCGCIGSGSQWGFVDVGCARVWEALGGGSCSPEETPSLTGAPVWAGLPPAAPKPEVIASPSPASPEKGIGPEVIPFPSPVSPQPKVIKAVKSNRVPAPANLASSP
ncbi:MAG: hypothetical protein JO112_14215 [Planctomycetes bacterium]|nr:hypothetical protein [Planctomycetota bacterium]